jgi:hypothetical protein
MFPIGRLALTLVAVASLAAGSTAGACGVGRGGACLVENAPCGPSREHGKCETTKHRLWRGVKLVCGCHIPTPHGSIVVP